MRSPECTQFLADVLVTAVESGYSWFLWDRYRFGSKEPYYARCYELNEDENGYDYDHPLEVTIDTIQKGIGVLMLDVRLPAAYRQMICEAWRSKDAGMIDAADADTILQYGLLGENRYA